MCSDQVAAAATAPDTAITNFSWTDDTLGGGVGPEHATAGRSPTVHHGRQGERSPWA